MKIVLSNTTVTKPTEFIRNQDFIQPYVQVKPKPKSRQLLTHFIESVENNIPNKLKPDEYHITVIYALNECRYINIKKSIVFNREYNVLVKKAELFQNDEEQSVHLVLRVESPQLDQFHQHLKQNLRIETSFPDYKPHITISSNAHQEDPSITYEDVVEIYQRAAEEINEALGNDGLPLVFWRETVTPVNDDWK